MLAKKNRLKDNADFRHVYKDGKYVAARTVVLYFIKTNSSVSRIGFVVSKKVGSSHVRSRIKRLLREVFRAQLPIIKPGFDIVVVARHAIVTEDYTGITATVVGLLKRARLVVGGQKK